MSRFTILLAALCCGIGAVVSAEQAAQARDTKNAAADLEKFRGTWTVERVEAEGKDVPLEMFKGMTLTFDGEKYTVKVGDQVVQVGTHKLDPSRSPKTFDDTVLMGDNQGRVIPGIYEISGDTLKFCFDPEGKHRPSEFRTAPGSQVTLGVYKRVKR